MLRLLVPRFWAQEALRVFYSPKRGCRRLWNSLQAEKSWRGLQARAEAYIGGSYNTPYRVQQHNCGKIRAGRELSYKEITAQRRYRNVVPKGCPVSQRHPGSCLKPVTPPDCCGTGVVRRPFGRCRRSQTPLRHWPNDCAVGVQRGPTSSHRPCDTPHAGAEAERSGTALPSVVYIPRHNIEEKFLPQSNAL